MWICERYRILNRQYELLCFELEVKRVVLISKVMEPMSASPSCTVSWAAQNNLLPLLSLERWSSAWGMKFNTKNVKLCPSPVECHILPIYNLCGHVLSSVQIAKYLGITLTDELSWSSHVHSIHSRANSTLGFLRRNLRRCPAKLRDCYITLLLGSDGVPARGHPACPHAGTVSVPACRYVNHTRIRVC